MMPQYRAEILRGIESVCRLFPSYRLCQMVANLSLLTQRGPDDHLADVTDADFLREMSEHVRRRERRLADEPPGARDEASRYDSNTLPPLLPQILRGLEELSTQYPDKPFVPLVLQVAEWTKEFAPFDFWDVEDADFLRAIESHRPVQTA
jgi:hypothetical protein